MTTYSYLRVSTDSQDVKNQRHGIMAYAKKNGLGKIRFVKESASGRLSWRKRAIGKLLTETAKPGDTVIFAEVSRMARSTLQVLEILEHCMESGITVHITKTNMIFDGSMQAKITATVLGLAADIERDFISSRTKEALNRKRQEGAILGRPKGKKSAYLKLDSKKSDIKRYLDLKINKRTICKLVECSPATLYSWIDRRQDWLNKASA